MKICIVNIDLNIASLEFHFLTFATSYIYFLVFTELANICFETFASHFQNLVYDLFYKLLFPMCSTQNSISIYHNVLSRCY